MNILITAKDFELTNALRNTIEEKLKRFTSYVDDEQKIRVVLESRKYGQRIEVLLQLNGYMLKAESMDENLYTAIDLVVDKLKQQISRYYHRAEETQNSIRYFQEMDDEELEDTESSRITKRKRFSLKPMSEEEAILQAELLGHNFFMFQNSDTDSICLLYRRKDGNFGLIEGN